MLKRILLASFLTLLLTTPSAYSQDASSDPRRTEQGYEVTKDNYLNIPSDMKVTKVAGNVITTEPDITYLARKLEEQNQRIAALEGEIKALEARLQAAEQK